MAARSGYTSTLFLIDVSPSMGTMRRVPDGVKVDERGKPFMKVVTDLEWVLEYVLKKVQTKVMAGLKTEKIGVFLIGSDVTKNLVNDERPDEYENIEEYIQLQQPGAATLDRIRAIRPSQTVGDPLNGLVVALQAMSVDIGNKRTWTRNIILLTDGRNEIDHEGWEDIARRAENDNVHLTLIGVDFDDDAEDGPFKEEDKPELKRENEEFYQELLSRVPRNFFGTASRALAALDKPQIRLKKSQVNHQTLRIGDPEQYPEQSLEISVKYSKAVAKTLPPSMKKISKKSVGSGALAGRKLPRNWSQRADDGDITMAEPSDAYAGGKISNDTKYFLVPERKSPPKGVEEGAEEPMEEVEVEVEREQLQKAYKYGATYVPKPSEEEGGFQELETKKGIDMLMFIPQRKYDRYFSMGEPAYIFADKTSTFSQTALSSVIHGLVQNNLYMLVRLVRENNKAPIVGVCRPVVFADYEYLHFVRVPFAEDYRKYSFPSLTRLYTTKAKRVTEHKNLPTKDLDAKMDAFVDAMDLTGEGPEDEEEDEDGNMIKYRKDWFDIFEAYSPSVHRIQQAIVHGAMVDDLDAEPLPPPHLELTKFFNPPASVLKRARPAVEDCIEAFDVKKVPPKVKRTKRGGAPIPETLERIDIDALLGGSPPPKAISSSASPTRLLSKAVSKPASPRRKTSTPPASVGAASPAHAVKAVMEVEEVDSDATVDDEDEGYLQAYRRTTSPAAKQADGKTPEPARQTPTATAASSATSEPQTQTNRLINVQDPLGDWDKAYSHSGDLFDKMFLDMASVIPEVVEGSFSHSRFDLAMECMKVFRRTAIDEDGAEEYNQFIRTFKSTCPKPKFWEKVRKEEGLDLGLITSAEENNSDVSVEEARKFMSS